MNNHTTVAIEQGLRVRKANDRNVPPPIYPCIPVILDNA